MSRAPVRFGRHDVDGGAIWEIVLDRPEVHHAVDADSAELLCQAWRIFRDDDSLSVAILRSEGTQSFCAGADLKGLAGLASLSVDAQSPSADVRREGPMGGTRIVQTKPVITVSQGYTYAGGLELFCHGHIRLAEPNATFSVACRRWGVPLIDGGTVYLPRLLGWGAALPLIITGQKIDAARAYQIGLVWELVPEGKGVDRAFAMARQIAALPQDCLRADLTSAIRGWHEPLEQALAHEGESLGPVISSESTHQGVARFLAGQRFWFE
ncbi:enoyl-CoA hydratase/isomerase family protein [bacterium]|nr:enoyl-CoA hydratase/isomerase family protein [bacterium]